MEESVQKSRGFNASTLKMIAIVGMTMNHIGNVFWDQLPALGRIITFAPGGLTFPIMAFLLTEGYRHTRDFKKYALRLLLFAAVALVPFWWALFSALNILFTLFLGLVTIYLYDNMKNRSGFWVAFVAITLVTVFCDWGLMGVPMVLCYHVISNPHKRVIIPALIPCVVMGMGTLTSAISSPAFILVDALPNLLYAFIGCVATVPLLLHYNGEKGNASKYFFYAYYPGHLLLLGVLRGLLFGQWV